MKYARSFSLRRTPAVALTLSAVALHLAANALSGQAFRVADINATAFESDPLGTQPGVVLGSTLLFPLSTEEDSLQLWSSNGTAAGTGLLLNVAPGEQSNGLNEFTRIGSTVFFVADEVGFGAELWRTDGTAPGTFRLSDVAPGPASPNVHQLRAVGSTLFFVAGNSTAP